MLGRLSPAEALAAIRKARPAAAELQGFLGVWSFRAQGLRMELSSRFSVVGFRVEG